MLTALVAMAGLIAMSSLAIDVGLIWAARTQLQGAADSAALAGAARLIDADVPAVTLPAAEAAAVDVASRNGAVGATSVQLPTSDLTFGGWNLDSRTLDTSVDLTDPDQVSAVDVVARLDGVANGPVPALMSRILGRNSFSVAAQATAYLGYAGSVGPGVIELPVGIDCCKLKGPDCDQDYCGTITTNPPSPCDLDTAQSDGVTTVSCLQFHNSGDQNACWTGFDGDHPSINTSDMKGIVENGTPYEIRAGEDYYVDNGDKVPVIQEIEDKFLGNGSYGGDAAGTDRYAPYDGVDSWVVGLPVFECQSDTNCATGTAATMVGVVCFEIREIVVTPDKVIRGRFLCRSDPLWDECDLGPTVTGGLNFDVRADIPVLVR